ncbi:hypothetical protein ZWY2020_038943 [Hordeum vulgare]|nr:hypothetical protein ZWY2020_038943 [Hordeum vulgare]
MRSRGQTAKAARCVAATFWRPHVLAKAALHPPPPRSGGPRRARGALVRACACIHAPRREPPRSRARMARRRESVRRSTERDAPERHARGILRPWSAGAPLIWLPRPRLPLAPARPYAVQPPG